MDATEQLVSHHSSEHAGCFQRQNLGIVVLFFLQVVRQQTFLVDPSVSYHCCVSRLCARLPSACVARQYTCPYYTENDDREASFNVEWLELGVYGDLYFTLQRNLTIIVHG